MLLVYSVNKRRLCQYTNERNKTSMRNALKTIFFSMHCSERKRHKELDKINMHCTYTGSIWFFIIHCPCIVSSAKSDNKISYFTVSFTEAECFFLSYDR